MIEALISSILNFPKDIFMKYVVLVVFLLTGITIPALAQLEANNWYWGAGRAVQFTPVVRELTADTLHRNYEGCISISERISGRVLFYSDFISTVVVKSVNLRNGQQNIITDTPMRGYSTASQGLMVVPDPADCFRYYLFSMDIKKSGIALLEKTKLSYSVIDTRDGVGRVITADNVILDDYLAEGMTGTVQSNGRDFWVVVYKYNTPTFIALSITKNGINSSNAVYSPAAVPATDAVILDGKLKLSPNGKKLAGHVSGAGLGLFDFDNATGKVSNYKVIPTALTFTFSPDNSKFYTIGKAPYQGNAALQAGRMYQYDFSDPTFTRFAIDTTQAIWYLQSASMQIAPNGKIYFVSSPGDGTSPVWNLSSIDNPNGKGNTCALNINTLRLKDYQPGKDSPLVQLPNYMDYIFNSSGVLGAEQLTLRCALPDVTAMPDSGCIGSTLTFIEKSNYATSRLWKFPGGTPSTSTDSVATVRYSTSGTFKVILEVENDNGTITDTTEAVVYPDPIAHAGADKTFCPNSTLQLGAPPEPGNTYQWQPTTDLDNPAIANPTLTPKAASQYILTVTSPTGCIAHDTVVVSPGAIKALVTKDTTICAGTAVQLVASGGAQYKWTPNTGLNNDAIENPIAAPGSTTTYKVVVSSGTCIDSATVMITVLPSPTANAGQDRTICLGTSTDIGEVAQAGMTYSWQPVAGLTNPTASNPTASPLTTTEYILTVTGSNGCAVTDTVVVRIGNIKSTVSSDTVICPGSSVRLFAGGGTVYNWSPIDELDDPTTGSPLASPSKTTTYKVIVSSGICSDSAFVTVNVAPPPIADAGSDTLICVTGSVNIGATPIAGNSYSWFPGTGLNDPSIANPIASPVQTTNYILTVINAMGCVNHDTVVVSNNSEVTREFSIGPDDVVIEPSKPFRQLIEVPTGAITWKLSVGYNPYIAEFTSLGNSYGSVKATVLSDKRGVLQIGGSGNSGEIELLFKAYLPNTSDTTYPFNLTIDTVRMEPCESATAKSATLKLADYCARSIRIVSVSGARYYLQVKDKSIDFGVGLSGNVRLELFDYIGNSVLVVSDGALEAGEYSAALDLPVGVYYCRMRAGMYESVGKVLIAR
jgi:hypothetical protein